MEANMCHLEVDFDNIWENFIKPAQVAIQYFVSVIIQFEPPKNYHGKNMKLTGMRTKFLERKMTNCFETFIFYSIFRWDITVCVI